MAVFVDLAFSLSGLLTASAFLLAWHSARPSARAPLRCAFVVLTAYALAGSWVVSSGLERLMSEGLNARVDDRPPARTAILLLAASGMRVSDWSGNHLEELGPHGASRVLEALRIYRQVTDGVIVSSGGPPDVAPDATPDSVLMRDALVARGVQTERVILESESRNTHDQAVRVAAMLRGLRADRIVLVTSASHMKRALGAFRAQGVVAIPAAARNPLATMAPLQRIIPSQAGLSASSALAHELAGLTYYASRGWLR